MTWIPFNPVLTSSHSHRQYLHYAIDLSETSAVQEPVEKLMSIERIRGEATEGRNKSLSSDVRSALLILADLIAQGWACRVHQSKIEVARPFSSRVLNHERNRVRRQLLVERDRQLRAQAVRAFITRMERRRFYRGHWVSIFSLMRDGGDLAARLRKLQNNPNDRYVLNYHTAMRPFLEVVRSGQVCERTGLLLSDIWRYFRFTWANPYRSVPGRSLLLLVRDAAVEPHPVIGIAALASSAVQIGVRDAWIGWAPEDYVHQLREGATERHILWLLRLISNSLAEIYLDDLFDPALSPLSPRTVAKPTPEIISWLEAYVRTQRDMHQRLADRGEHKTSTPGAGLFNDNRWQRQAETPLFRSKRAETLAMLLRARAALSGGEPLTASRFQELLDSPEKRKAVQALIRRAKSDRVGIAMADISVCGAVPPYSGVLGGKLISMLLMSPEVITAYRDRYASTESVIASSLAGHPITRPSNLVYLGTTSLYGTEPTQYTRVAVPSELLGGRRGESLRYQLLGRTEGYGTIQFSSETVQALSTLLSQSQEGQRVHSIFGEGVSPRLRKIRDGLNRLGLPSDALLTHGSPRLVYGVALARNFREYLLGLDEEPYYLVPLTDPTTASDRISLWWAQRWLKRRIGRDDILDDLARHKLTYPIRHGARVPTPVDGTRRLSLFEDINIDP